MAGLSRERTRILLFGSAATLGGGVILPNAEKHKFYIDAEYSKGASIEQPYAVNVGYRYMW
ncbi:autotransporter outer membrane beta-barrel domain-containing protein [Pseudomonas sp. TH15]|uniref:autotransporter outer membrane beta-barrel domain-containing protein n=1 Tax=Pseudomonas sp. TH15 TaxID=2796381 RepID=UPI003144F85F